MPASLFDPAHERALLARLDRLVPDARARFGTLDAPRMLCHLIDALRNALGETTVKPIGSIMANPLLRKVIIYWMPWPKGKVKTHPAYLATAPAQFDADRATLRAYLQQAAERGRSGGRFGVHPLFGDLTTTEWGGLLARHVDHHLAQFGA